MHAVRIPDHTYQIIRELAGRRPMQTVISQAVENLRRQRLLEEANAAYAALRQDPDAWKQEERERAEWDAALADGLEDD